MPLPHLFGWVPVDPRELPLILGGDDLAGRCERAGGLARAMRTLHVLDMASLQVRGGGGMRGTLRQAVVFGVGLLGYSQAAAAPSITNA